MILPGLSAVVCAVDDTYFVCQRPRSAGGRAASAPAALPQLHKKLPLADARISGSLTWLDDPAHTNYYDPGNGCVPGDYENSGALRCFNLPVLDNETTFGYLSPWDAGYSTITTDLHTQGLITHQIIVNSDSDMLHHSVTLSSSAFRAASGYTVVQDTFSGLKVAVKTTLHNDTITIVVGKGAAMPVAFRGTLTYAIQLLGP